MAKHQGIRRLDRSEEVKDQMTAFISTQPHSSPIDSPSAELLSHCVYNSHNVVLGLLPKLVIFILMRSVSIVYKKPYPREDPSPLPATRTLIKRSVDEYYTRLVQKQRTKQEATREKEAAVERAKLRTSNSQRQGDKFNILQTLSIVQMSLRQPHLPVEREESKRAPGAGVGAAVARETYKTVLRGLDLSPPLAAFEEEEKEERGMHCKLKSLYRGKQAKETVIVLTANFVTNEHYFWAEEPVEEQCLKPWRLLQSYASIVWVCRCEGTFKKLAKFAKANGVRLDAVYLILPRRDRRLLSFSCQAIETDFGVRFLRSNTPLVGREDRRMVVLCGVTVDRGQTPAWQSLMGCVPAIRNCRSVAHLIRIDTADRARLNSAVRVLSQETLPRPLNVEKILADFEHADGRGRVQEQCGCKFKPPKTDSPPLLVRLEEIKVNMTKFFTQSLSLSLNDRFPYDQSENSLQFLIGDSLRRNYRIFQQAQVYAQEFAGFDAHRKAHAGGNETGGRAKGKERQLARRYRNTAYFWDL